jgi:hypothetical protein
MIPLVQSFLKWAALMALLLSPLAMQPAAAASTTVVKASVPGHCEEKAPAQGKAMLSDCTMGCASALPAAPFVGAPQRRPTSSFEPSAQLAALTGRHLEIEIPPPRD